MQLNFLTVYRKAIFYHSSISDHSSGAWVAFLVASVFFILGYAWYFGQNLLRQYLHCYAQTTPLTQMPTRLGYNNDAAETSRDDLVRRNSCFIDHSSDNIDDEDECGSATAPMIHILPASAEIANSNGNGHTTDEHGFRKSLTGNVVFTITPGLGVFLTTSSRNTPHAFERVLAQIHAVSKEVTIGDCYNSFI